MRWVVVLSVNFIIQWENVSKCRGFWEWLHPLSIHTWLHTFSLSGLKMNYDSLMIPSFCSSRAHTAATWCTRTWWWRSVSMTSNLWASTSAGCVMARKRTECNAAPACQVSFIYLWRLPTYVFLIFLLPSFCCSWCHLSNTYLCLVLLPVSW